MSSLSREELVSRGRAVWPELATSTERFAAFLEARWSDDAPPGEGVAGDLYLACACASGEPAAQRAFAAAQRAVIRAAVSRIDAPPDRLDEAVQLTLDRLLVAEPGATARVAQYSGRSDLAGFVRVVALRVALSMVRGDARGQLGEDALADLADAHDDPEQRYLKQLYQEQFRTAFAAAIESLPARDRSLLRHQVVDGLTIDQLAAIHGRTRSTMGRQVLEARSRLITETRARLREQLKIDRAELSSILRLVRSSVDVSVRRLLGDGVRVGAA
jgi:RNA polymerase sigma-70 factor, ECF subfamily